MKQINLVLIFLILVFALFPFFLPNHIDEKMEYEIQAPIGLVFDEFSELKQFSKWEKFTSNDENTLKTSHPATEDEKEYAEWKSNSSSVGNGKITIENFEINKFIEYSLKYDNWEKEDVLRIDFDLLPTGHTKIVANYKSQEVPYFYRYFLYFNSPLEKLEESLTSFNDLILKRLKKERKDGNLIYGEFKVVNLNKQILMAVKKTPAVNEKEINKSVDDAFETIYKALVNDEDSYDFDLGFPHVYITDVNQEKNKVTLFAGVQLINEIQLPRNMQRVVIPAGEYLLTLHQGSRAKKKHTLTLMQNYAKSKKLTLDNRELEVFLNDPKETDSLQLKTRIYIPIKSQ